MENYKVWLRGLNNTELNEELKKVLRNVGAATSDRVAEAWSKMYDVAVAEMYRRDHK